MPTERLALILSLRDLDIAQKVAHTFWTRTIQGRAQGRMPPINLAISGLPECVALVRPLAAKIVSAFAPYGIDLRLEDGIPLSTDPETLVDGWTKLAQALEGRSNNFSPTNLVLTHIPPDHDGSIGRNNLNELRLFQAGLNIDIEPTFESKSFYTARRDGVGNQDFLVNHDSTS